MQLSNLVVDPFSGFGDEEEVSRAEAIGRQAVKEIFTQAMNDPTLSQAVRNALSQLQKATEETRSTE
jgi:hypothetical protein